MLETRSMLHHHCVSSPQVLLVSKPRRLAIGSPTAFVTFKIFDVTPHETLFFLAKMVVRLLPQC